MKVCGYRGCPYPQQESGLDLCAYCRATVGTESRPVVLPKSQLAPAPRWRSITKNGVQVWHWIPRLSFVQRDDGRGEFFTVARGDKKPPRVHKVYRESVNGVPRWAP